MSDYLIAEIIRTVTNVTLLIAWASFVYWRIKKLKQEGEAMRPKKVRKEQETIKIKKTLKGLMTTDTGFVEHEFWVQLTKDEDGMTLSIDDYTIPLEPLGIEVRMRND